jgi:hypothetical protein
LANKHVKTVGLYAYLDKIPFYNKLGFKQDQEFTVLTAKNPSAMSTAEAKKARKEDMKKIIDFDQTCFGASRRKLLEPILLYPNNSCYFSIQNGQVIGFAVAKVYDGKAELGPLECRHEWGDVAVDLLNAVLSRLEGLEVSMCVSMKGKQLLSTLKKSGFKKGFRVARMFYGPLATNGCVYAAESLERG